MNSQSNTTEERCDCGGVIVFDDEAGIAHCYSCGSHECYTTPALRARAHRLVLEADKSGGSKTIDQPTEAEVNKAILIAGEVRDLYEAGDRMPWMPVVRALVSARVRCADENSELRSELQIANSYYAAHEHE